MGIKGIEDIDTDKQKITVDFVSAMTWNDRRISCARECEVAEVISPCNK